MRLSLTDDQQFFRETTTRFLGDLVPPGALRQLRDDPAGFERGYWTRGAELGWVSLLVDEADGGGRIGEYGLVDLTLVAHEFGAFAAPGPLIPANIVAGALSHAGGHAQVLAEVMSGSAIATWAYSEPPPNGSLGQIGLQITVDGAEVVLNGVKRPVESAGVAQWLLITGRTGDGLSQVLVPADAPGVTVTPMKSVDLTRRFSKVTFDNVRVPLSAVVGSVGAAAEDVEQQLRTALVLCAAQSVGAMQRTFDMTVEWAFDRYSFGRPLASYQALKHRFADMKSWLEAGHAIADSAATAVARHSSLAAEAASSAKAFVGTYGSELMHDCVQMHGGIGVTYEHDLHLYLRRQTVDRALYGTPNEHYLRITDAMLARESAA